MTDVRLVGLVGQLWRYPVKSMQGLPADALACTEAGFALDREWAVVDATTGRVLSAKTVPPLLDATVQLTDGPTIVLPDGSHVRPGASDADAALGRWLDRDVRLRQRAEHDGGGYDMTFDPPDDQAEQYEIPIADGSFFDLTSVHLLTRATLDHVRAEQPELDWDVRRFRPNLVVDTDDAIEPFAEDTWCGSALRIGDVQIDLQQPTVRCAMPLRAQPGLPRSLATYRALVDLHDNHLGVYGAITAGGTISCGDEVWLSA